MRKPEANRNPRRWVDDSGRVRVIEGWHPSQPSQLGYNLIVDGDWIGTFSTLDLAANAASPLMRFSDFTNENSKLASCRASI